MSTYAILAICGVFALLAFFALADAGPLTRKRRSSGGYDGYDTNDDGGWSFGGSSDYDDNSGSFFSDDD